MPIEAVSDNGEQEIDSIQIEASMIIKELKLLLGDDWSKKLEDANHLKFRLNTQIQHLERLIIKKIRNEVMSR